MKKSQYRLRQFCDGLSHSRKRTKVRHVAERRHSGPRAPSNSPHIRLNELQELMDRGAFMPAKPESNKTDLMSVDNHAMPAACIPSDYL